MYVDMLCVRFECVKDILHKKSLHDGLRMGKGYAKQWYPRGRVPPVEILTAKNANRY